MAFKRPEWNRAEDYRVLLKNARLFDAESGLDQPGELLIAGTKIADFGADLGSVNAQEVIDCQGLLLSPGLIDIQVHFRDPGQEYKEDIETGSRSAAAGGVTTVACMPNTKPVIDDPAMVAYVHQRCRDVGYVNVCTYACISMGMKGEQITEMGLLKEAGAVGFTDDGLPAMNAQLMRRALEYSAMLDVPIAQHAEDLNLSAGGCMNEGAVSTRLGLKGIPNASEAVIVARDILLAELTGGKYHLLHASTAESVELVRQAKKKGLRVTCEAAPHHFTLTDEMVEQHRAYAKMNPPLRSAKDRDAILEGLADGTIDAVATDHAPHEPEAKRVPMDEAAFGIVGLETMLPVSLDALYHSGKMSLRDVMAAMTYKPADIIGREAGRLKKGAPADLALIDLDRQWQIKPEGFQSRSKNSPYVDYNVKGKAVQTWTAGSCVYFEEK
jgi:dihydroorotase